ncbi:MAG: hypothetical protein RJA44_2748 [Pseudomonadota bacterium]
MSSPHLHWLENSDQRVLGALRCVDVNTGARISAALDVRLGGVHLPRNRSGLYIIDGLPGWQAHAAAFDAAPDSPAPGSVTLTGSISDPGGHHLPRRFELPLPRRADPLDADQPDSLFEPARLALYPAPAAGTGVNWCVLRISVRETASGNALGGALLLVRVGERVLASGLSDWRGEALVGVPGVPVTTWSTEPGAVVVTETAAELQLIFDPLQGSSTPAAQVRAGLAPAPLPMVDPDQLLQHRATLPGLSQAQSLAAGVTRIVSLALALP